MNGWFPKFKFDGTIASGNAGIWITTTSSHSYQYDANGLAPIWANITLIYNRNNGTSQVGDSVINSAYNDYRGSVSGNWAGFLATGLGRLDRYNGTQLVGSINNATLPRFGGPQFGYLSPWQANERALIIEGTVAAIGPITDWQWERFGAFHVYVVATGTYTKEIRDPSGQNISIRTDENPIVVFMYDSYPWLVTGCSESLTFIRPFNSPFGYYIAGDLFFPDAIMVGERLQVAGSLADGTPRFDNYVDFSKPRTDLRLL